MKKQKEDNTYDLCSVGIDISSDFSQISYEKSNMEEPKSVSTIPGENHYLIPTVLFKIKNTNDWKIGDDALLRSKEEKEDKYTIRNLVELIHTGRPVYLDDRKYTPTDLFFIFFKGLADYLYENEGIVNTDYVTVTIEDDTKEAVDCIYDALRKLELDDDSIRVLSHTESFVYYTVNQKKDIWPNDVVMFDYGRDYFKYKRLRILRNKIPNIVMVDEQDFSDIFQYSALKTEEGRKAQDEYLLSIIKEYFYKKVISAVFLTGIGFADDFASESLIELCNKRRVFKGYNLLTKGACYGAVKRQKNLSYDDFLFQCKGRTKANIGMMIKDGEKNVCLMMSKAGVNWYEAGAFTKCILDDVKYIHFFVKSALGDYEKDIKIDLSQFPDRPRRTTRVEITLAYTDQNTCKIIVKDLGFGDFYKGSGMMVNKVINIDELFS